MEPVLSQQADFLSRIERDLSYFHEEMERIQKERFEDNEEGLRKQIASNAQAIVNATVLTSCLALLKMRLSIGYEKSGRFDFRATKKNVSDEIESSSSAIRSMMYALQERSKALRSLYQRYLDQQSGVEPHET